MLHNSGPYGPNETPVNMGAPLNISQLSTPMNMVQNLNNMSKMPQQSHPAATGHFNLPNYPSYGNPPLNVSPQMHPFQNYHPLGFQPSYMPQNSPMMQNTGWQNDMLPMSLNMHADHSQNVLNYPHLDKRLSEPVNSYKDINHLAKTPLNIPQLPNKPYQTEPEPLDNVPNTFNDRYKPYIANNEGLNLGLSIKSPEILLSDNTRRKNLENTVRLIENILINTTKNREMQHSMESEQDSEKNLDDNDTDVKNSLSREDLRADNSVDDSDEEMDSVPVKFDDNDEDEESENNLNDSEDESYKSDKDIKNKSNDNEDSCNDNVIVEVPLNPVEKERNDVKELEQTECRELDLKTVIKQEPIEIEKQIVVKIEQISSWTDTEHMSPFHRDSNGVLRDDAVHGNIIDSETSEVEALEIIKNGLSSNCYFECPQCSLLFEHPKRFLIHTKWHTFGHDKRAEVITKKEARERKERRKRIKLEGGDEDADVKTAGKGTKVWPCKDCDKVYYAKSSLSGHRQRYHSNRIRECKICSKIVAGWSAWKAHQASHNTDTGFPCNQCPKKFKYAHSLAKHKDTHLEKTHACPECPKKFGSQVLLKVHMKSHERAKQGASFHCSFCGKAFYDKFNMQIHERTHTNERPFVCDICNATFGCNSNLSRHLKVSHSSSKPYVCSTCARSFVSELIRDRHELRVHGDPAEFKYTCKQCPSRYMKQVDLRKHTYKMHPKPKSETKSK